MKNVELATLTHRYPDWLGVDGYEKLLYDALNADQSHFVHSDEVNRGESLMIYFAQVILQSHFVHSA